MDNIQNLEMVKSISDAKAYLFNVVASCLFKESRFYDESDERRKIVLQALLNVVDVDPEFILQLAIYLRHSLYIRSTTNFILAFCSVHPKTQPFLKKYFAAAINLPSDLLEVGEFAQLVIRLSKNNFESLEVQKFKFTDIRKELKFPKPL